MITEIRHLDLTVGVTVFGCERKGSKSCPERDSIHKWEIATVIQRSD